MTHVTDHIIIDVFNRMLTYYNDLQQTFEYIMILAMDTKQWKE